jgi:hypothetical protein
VSIADGFAGIRGRLALPLIAAPMFLVSGFDLVAAACINGVIGAFPTVNCRTSDELDAWLSGSASGSPAMPTPRACGRRRLARTSSCIAPMPG